MFLTGFRGVGESGLGFSKGWLFLGGSSWALGGLGWAREEAAFGKSPWAPGRAYPPPHLPPCISYLSFLLPQLLQLIPSPPEPQGHKLTPADQAWAPPDPWGPMGVKEPPPKLPRCSSAPGQGGSWGVPSNVKPGVGAFAGADRMLGGSGMLGSNRALAGTCKIN